MYTLKHARFKPNTKNTYHGLMTYDVWAVAWIKRTQYIQEKESLMKHTLYIPMKTIFRFRQIHLEIMHNYIDMV